MEVLCIQNNIARLFLNLRPWIQQITRRLTRRRNRSQLTGRSSGYQIANDRQFYEAVRQRASFLLASAVLARAAPLALSACKAANALVNLPLQDSEGAFGCAKLLSTLGWFG